MTNTVELMMERRQLHGSLDSLYNDKRMVMRCEKCHESMRLAPALFNDPLHLSDLDKRPDTFLEQPKSRAVVMDDDCDIVVVSSSPLSSFVVTCRRKRLSPYITRFISVF